MTGMPQFTTTTDGRGDLVVCTLDGVTGTARIFSKGELDAKQRAEARARQLLKEQAAASG